MSDRTSRMRKRRATSRRPAIQVADYGRRLRLERCASTASTSELDQYLQNATADGDLRRRLRRYPRRPRCQICRAVYGKSGREPARSRIRSTSSLTSVAGRCRPAGLAVGAHRCRERRPGAWRRRSTRRARGIQTPARQRRDGHQRFDRHGQQRDGRRSPVHQQSVAEQRQDRCGDGVAARTSATTTSPSCRH